MRYSIKKQLAFIFIFLMSGTILLCWFTNVFFLERYYMLSKRQDLMDVYVTIDQWYNDGKINTEEFDSEMLKICSIYNISFIVTDASSNIVKTSINDSEEFNQQLRDTIFARGDANYEVLEEGDNYTISNMKDPINDIEYMAMWGDLDGGNFFMIRTAMEGIRDSVRLANVFLLYVGLSAIVIASLVICVVSSKITDPILQLANISEKMTNLDFETKYTGRDHNEIAVLGKHFNQMSQKLEDTICCLKMANMDLQKDVENKTKTDEMRKEFLANVSHELKTPIALIQGYAEGLKEGVIDDPESWQYYCDVIMDETKKMNHLVKRLITLNQMESGNELFTMERFDITTLIDNCIQSSEILTKQAEIKVFYEKENGIFVWADEYLVEEVFRNYFSNAINHASGNKEIHVKTNLDENHVRISVFNTGNPIPEDSIERVWDKFYKVDKARTREYGGSGIGLSIVKAVMESMGQNYGCRNYEDGVEFWFELDTK